jgi:hypothetical protein
VQEEDLCTEISRDEGYVRIAVNFIDESDDSEIGNMEGEEDDDRDEPLAIPQ